MMEHPIIIFCAVLVFLYGLFSLRAMRSPITAPMVFCLIGIIVSPDVLNINELGPLRDGMSFLAELALILILFVGASTIDLPALLKQRQLPVRLLGIGLPLTMLLGFILAILIFGEFNWWLAGLVALILAPTDAALGQVVVTSEKLPMQIKQSINVESGLNDGIALPLVLMCLAALGSEAETNQWLRFMVVQLAMGPVVGGIVGYFGGWLVELAAKKKWMSETYQRLVAGSLALMAYAAAEAAGGNGFIAAFFAGLLLGTKTSSVRHRIQEFGEAEGEQLSLFVFLVFGMVLVPLARPFWDAQVWLYAVLSLTVVRIVPVLACLAGSGLDQPGKWFVSWFGPRGIASVLYLIIAVGDIGISGHEKAFSIITLTVLMSILLHGLSAVPLTNLYVRYLEKEQNKSP